jgi:hypothetical protein
MHGTSKKIGVREKCPDKLELRNWKKAHPKK